MTITVAELVEVPFLSIRFHAGAGGGGRLVAWAHTSDLPNATDWLAPGDLLMSNGLNLPDTAEAQVSFLLELDAAGLSGLALGDDLHAPALAPEFLERAEKLEFPVLAIPRDVPFVAVSKAVANANTDEEHKRLVQTVQLYEALRDAVSNGRSGATLLSELGRQLDCRLLLLDAVTALPVLAAETEPPAGLADRLVEELRGRKGKFPAVLRVECNGTGAFALRVPTGRPTALVALHDSGRTPDVALLQHAANLAALEVERVTTERDLGLRMGPSCSLRCSAAVSSPPLPRSSWKSRGSFRRTPCSFRLVPARRRRTTGTCTTSWPSARCLISSSGTPSDAWRPFRTPRRRAPRFTTHWVPALPSV